CVDFLPGSIGPTVQLYLRHAEPPTTGLFDYTKTITPPGSCLSVSRTDLPPLRPGRYYLMLVNTSPTAQSLHVHWDLLLDPNSARATPVPGNTPITPIIDDATTNSTIFITNDQRIVTANVGVVLKHPRVSDLDLTLVSPQGQRILLFE